MSPEDPEHDERVFERILTALRRGQKQEVTEIASRNPLLASTDGPIATYLRHLGTAPFAALAQGTMSSNDEPRVVTGFGVVAQAGGTSARAIDLRLWALPSGTGKLVPHPDWLKVTVTDPGGDLEQSVQAAWRWARERQLLDPNRDYFWDLHTNDPLAGRSFGPAWALLFIKQRFPFLKSLQVSATGVVGGPPDYPLATVAGDRKFEEARKRGADRGAFYVHPTMRVPSEFERASWIVRIESLDQLLEQVLLLGLQQAISSDGLASIRGDHHQRLRSLLPAYEAVHAVQREAEALRHERATLLQESARLTKALERRKRLGISLTAGITIGAVAVALLGFLLRPEPVTPEARSEPARLEISPPAVAPEASRPSSAPVLAAQAPSAAFIEAPPREPATEPPAPKQPAAHPTPKPPRPEPAPPPQEDRDLLNSKIRQMLSGAGGHGP